MVEILSVEELNEMQSKFPLKPYWIGLVFSEGKWRWNHSNIIFDAEKHIPAVLDGKNITNFKPPETNGNCMMSSKAGIYENWACNGDDGKVAGICQRGTHPFPYCLSYRSNTAAHWYAICFIPGGPEFKSR